MMSLPINVVIKMVTVDKLQETFDKLKKIKEDNPDSVMKITIKIVPNN